MVKTSDKFTPLGSARNDWLSGRLQNELGLLERILVAKVPQELKEPQVPRYVTLAEATKPPQVRLQRGAGSG